MKILATIVIDSINSQLESNKVHFGNSVKGSFTCLTKANVAKQFNRRFNLITKRTNIEKFDVMHKSSINLRGRKKLSTGLMPSNANGEHF
jgi:hypothetical protein